MELDRQERIQRELQQSQDVMSRLKISEVCDNRGAREVPFGHGAMGANAANRESFGQIGSSGGAGQMVSFPKVEQTSRASDLRSWFRKSGVEGEKLTQLLRTCASEFLTCPQDLQDFHENGELALLFPRRVLFHCVEHALRVNGNIPPKKTDATGVQGSTSLVKASRPAGDIWANNDKVVVAGDPAGGSALSDPVAEAARADAYWRFEQIANSYPEFLPKVARTPAPLNFGLTQLTPDGERALRSNLPCAYDALLAPNTRTQMRDTLQMGDANCTIMLDVGDRDVQGNVVLLERLVEVGPQVEAILSTISLMIPLQTKRGEEWVRSGLPCFFWDIVVNPTAALSTTGKMTGEPVRADVRPFHGGSWRDGVLSFMPGESSSLNAATKPQILGVLKWENDSLSIFHDKTRMDAGMQRLAIMQAQVRALMVGMLKRDIQGSFPQISETQVLAEPAIAMHDECWKLMKRLETHANGYYILYEASKKTPHPTASPFGPHGVMMKQTKLIVSLYNKVDQDVAAIASCQTRCAGAMMMRLSGMRRLVEFMDAHSGRMFDLSAEMRATKGGSTLVKMDANDQVEVPTAAAQATPKAAIASPPKGAGVANTSTPGSSSWPRGAQTPPPNPLRIKAVSKVEAAISTAAKKIKASLMSQAGAKVIRLARVKDCLLSYLGLALKADGCRFVCLNDLRKEAMGRGVHGGEVSVELVEELMRNQGTHMAEEMLRVQQKFAPVPDKKRKGAAVTKGKNASTSPGPTKKVKKARETGPQKKVSWESSRAKQGSSGGLGRPGSGAEVLQFEDVTDEVEAAATSGSNACERLDRSRRIHGLQDCTQSELAKERAFVVEGMTVEDALKCKVPLQHDGGHKTVELYTIDRLMGDVKSGLIEIEEVISFELDQAGDIILPPGFGQEEGCNTHEDGTCLPMPSLPRKDSSSRFQSSSPILLPDAMVKAICAKTFADPDGYRLLPGVGALDLTKLTWAAQHRLELVQMCTVQCAMLLNVPINDGIDGGFKMTPYSRDLLEADLRVQLFEISEAETAPELEPRVQSKFFRCGDLMGAPATSGGGGTMSGAASERGPMLSESLGWSNKARGPELGVICGIEAGELGEQLAGGPLPFDEVVTQVATQMLAIADCKNWKTAISQLSLRSIHYTRRRCCVSAQW
jgi:hypothetical protein